MQMTHKPLTKDERDRLTTALRANVNEGTALLQDKKTTSFAYGDLENGAVITAVKSVPCHY